MEVNVEKGLAERYVLALGHIEALLKLFTPDEAETLAIQTWIKTDKIAKLKAQLAQVQAATQEVKAPEPDACV
jgi:hypothetical protein